MVAGFEGNRCIGALSFEDKASWTHGKRIKKLAGDRMSLLSGRGGRADRNVIDIYACLDCEDSELRAVLADNLLKAEKSL